MTKKSHKTPLGARNTERRNLCLHIHTARAERRRMSATSIDYIGDLLGPWDDLYETDEGAMFSWTREDLTLLALITPSKPTVVELYSCEASDDAPEMLWHRESTMLTEDIEEMVGRILTKGGSNAAD